MLYKLQKRKDRQRRIRAKISGTALRPRLCVYRGLCHIYAQLIDDEKGVTLVSASDLKIKKGSKIERAEQVGKQLAQAAVQNKISEVVFDRGGNKYHGRVKALAQAARDNGLKI